MSAESEKALLIEVLHRYESALDHLRQQFEQNERAQGLHKRSVARIFAEETQGFIDLGNWLDIEIDRRVP